VNQIVRHLLDADAFDDGRERGSGLLIDVLGGRRFRDEEHLGQFLQRQGLVGMRVHVAQNGKPLGLGDGVGILLHLEADAVVGGEEARIQDHQFHDLVDGIQRGQFAPRREGQRGFHAQLIAEILHEPVHLQRLFLIEIDRRLRRKQTQQFGDVRTRPEGCLHGRVDAGIVVDDLDELHGLHDLDHIGDLIRGDGDQRVRHDLVLHAVHGQNALALLEVQEAGGLMHQRLGLLLNDLIVKGTDLALVCRRSDAALPCCHCHCFHNVAFLFYTIQPRSRKRVTLPAFSACNR